VKVDRLKTLWILVPTLTRIPGLDNNSLKPLYLKGNISFSIEKQTSVTKRRILEISREQLNEE